MFLIIVKVRDYPVNDFECAHPLVLFLFQKLLLFV